MIERQKTETTAEVEADEERVILRMHRKVTALAPAEARQLAQELLDAADESEEPPPVPPVPIRPSEYDDLPLTAIGYDSRTRAVTQFMADGLTPREAANAYEGFPREHNAATPCNCGSCHPPLRSA